jgi:hypothetical protein
MFILSVLKLYYQRHFTAMQKAIIARCWNRGAERKLVVQLCRKSLWARKDGVPEDRISVHSLSLYTYFQFWVIMSSNQVSNALYIEVSNIGN